MKTIIIVGGSGFLGQTLEHYFSEEGYLVKILTRTKTKKNHIHWDAKNIGKWAEQFNNTDIIINLSGKSVNCRYTIDNKKLIHDSRIDTTNLIGLAINLCENPPKVWVNSSTATIYKHSFIKEMSEENGEIGDDFSMNIAKSWENTFNNIKTPKTRKIIIRTAIVLGKKGGALIPLKRLVKFGLGGKQGKGNQKISWIHEVDFARAVFFLVSSNLKGVFNLCVPNPINNRIFMNTLRKVLKIPFGISHPKILLNFWAKIIGTETELILKSRNVIPQRLLNNKFSFKHSILESALMNLV